MTSQKAVLKRLKKLERVFAPPDDEPIILIHMWRPEQEEDFIGEVEDAARRLRAGEKVVTVPLGGVKLLEEWGII